MREGLKPDEEMAHDHRRAKVSSVVERFFVNALQCGVSGFSSLSAARG